MNLLAEQQTHTGKTYNEVKAALTALEKQLSEKEALLKEAEASKKRTADDALLEDDNDPLDDRGPRQPRAQVQEIEIEENNDLDLGEDNERSTIHALMEATSRAHEQQPRGEDGI